MVETSTVETPRKRGRPPKQAPRQSPEATETPQEIAESVHEPPPESEVVEPFPRIARDLPFDDLATYWNETLTQVQRELGDLYVYRDWPILKPVESVDKRGQLKLENSNVLKLSHMDPPLSRQLISERLGMGIYRFRLNQRIVRPHGTVCFCTYATEQDWNGAMPILDLDRLDRAHPSNAEYIRILKLKGILQLDENEEEMASTEVLGDVIKDLSQGLREKANGQPTTPQVVTSDMAGVIGPMIGLLKEQINQNRPPEHQGTVSDHVKSLVDLARSMAPPPTDTSSFIASQDRYTALVERMMLKDVERAEAEAKKARQEAEEFRLALPKPLTVDEQFDQLERAAKRYERITGSKRRQQEEEERPVDAMGPAGWAGTILGAAPVILQMWDRFNYTIAVMKGVPPSMLPAQPPAANGVNGTAQQPDNVVPINGQPGAASEDEEPAGPTPEEEMEQAKLRALGALVPPMLKYFGEKKSGTEFAQFVCDNFGQESFALVFALGKQNIMARLSEYPPVWSQLGNRIQEFSKFLDEFMNYQKAPVQ